MNSGKKVAGSQNEALTNLGQEIMSRLAAQPEASGPHPNADLLCGFLESRLTRTERQNILAHLAICSECRDVLASSAPHEARPLIEAKGRFRLDRWRWLCAAVAACLLFAAVLRPKGPADEVPPRVSRRAQRLEVLEPALQAPASAPRLISPKPWDAAAGERKATDQTSSVDKPSRLSSPNASVAEVPNRAPRIRSQAIGGSSLHLAERPADLRQPNSPLAPEASNRGTSSAAASGGRAQFAAEALAQTQLSTPPGERLALRNSPSAISARVFSSKANDHIKPLGALWSIDDGAPGALQRSDDQGRTWQSVAVGTSISFRAVSAVGSDVWAGGTDAALFHSADNGLRWTRVTVEGSKGSHARGTILTLKAVSAMDIQLQTSLGEKWHTFDGGTNWVPED